MGYRSVWSGIVGLLVVSLASPAVANDSSFGGAGGSVVPLKEDRVRMVSEKITLELKPTEGDDEAVSHRWHVDAQYLFENTSQEKVELTVGFPEAACGPSDGVVCPEDSSYTMRDLTTKVDGEEVELRVEKAEEVEDSEDWAGNLGRVHMFDVTFEPGERVVVEHEYRHNPSRSVGGFQLTYLTKTGRSWKGTIGSARFEVRVPKRHYYLSFPPEYSLVEREHSGEIDGDWTYVFEAEDWTPERDFFVHFGNHADMPWDPNCGPIERFDKLVAERIEILDCDEDGVICREEKRSVTEAKRNEILRDLGREGVEMIHKHDSGGHTMPEVARRCRNMPRAIHGYPFEDEELSEFFYPESFQAECRYCDAGESMAGGPEGGFRRVFHRPNPAFDEELLTPTERTFERAFELAGESLEDDDGED